MGAKIGCQTLPCIIQWIFFFMFYLVTAQYLSYDYIPALTLGGTNDSYGDIKIDLKEEKFNKIFRDSTYHIIRRDCKSCNQQKSVYYRRDTDISTFNAYNAMRIWPADDGDNVRKTDFNIFNKLDDAMQDGGNNNEWKYCGGADGIRGAFAECGATGEVKNEWTAVFKNNNQGKEALFSIYSPITQCGEQLQQYKVSIQGDVGDCGLHALNNLIGEVLFTQDVCKTKMSGLDYLLRDEKDNVVATLPGGHKKLLSMIGVEQKKLYEAFVYTNIEEQNTLLNDISTIRDAKEFLGLMVLYQITWKKYHWIALKWDQEAENYIWINSW
eukprot:491041_1